MMRYPDLRPLAGRPLGPADLVAASASHPSRRSAP